MDSGSDTERLSDTDKKTIKKVRRLINDVRYKKAIQDYEEHKDKYIYATKTRNYALKDPIIDWLNMYGDTEKKDREGQGGGAGRFVEYIMEKGLEYEEKIVNEIRKKIGEENVVRCKEDASRDTVIRDYKKTVALMQKRVHVIVSGMLIKPEERVYGYPDLIVRSDIAKVLFSGMHEETQEYIVIDIKSSTLTIKNNGAISDTGSIPAYKTQELCYVMGLKYLLGGNAREDIGYLLGRKILHTNGDVDGIAESINMHLCTVDYAKEDSIYEEILREAVDWHKRLRMQGDKMQVFPFPSVVELFPNMKNTSDSPWSRYKKEIAEYLGEITLLWYCGMREREIAHEKGIYSLRDPHCTPDALGVRGRKIAPLLDKILKINKEGEKKTYSIGYKDKIPEKIGGKREFFIDFEFCNNIVGVSKEQSIIFMIGIYDAKEKKYINMTAKRLIKSEEERIVQEMIQYIDGIGEEYVVYHWGDAEKRQMCEAMPEYIPKNWTDMIEVLHNSEVAVKGAYNFSLKSIARAMRKCGLIEDRDIYDGSIGNGLDAMVVAIQCDKDTKEDGDLLWSATKGGDLRDKQEIQDIITYNKEDCITMYDILEFIRNT